MVLLKHVSGIIQGPTRNCLGGDSSVWGGGVQLFVIPPCRLLSGCDSRPRFFFPSPAESHREVTPRASI